MPFYKPLGLITVQAGSDNRRSTYNTLTVLHRAGSKIEGLEQEPLLLRTVAARSPVNLLPPESGIAPHVDFGAALIVNIKSRTRLFVCVSVDGTAEIKATFNANEECLLAECCTVLVFAATTHRIQGVCQDHCRATLTQFVF